MTLRAHVEAIYASIASLLGTHDVQDVHTRLERELRHVVPQWSDHLPDCPGWYWYKPPGIGEPQLLLVSHGRIDTKLMADLGAAVSVVTIAEIYADFLDALLIDTADRPLLKDVESLGVAVAVADIVMESTRQNIDVASAALTMAEALDKRRSKSQESVRGTGYRQADGREQS